MLQELGKLYNISINELLCGERIAQENYQVKAEETIAGILSGSPFSFQERSDFWKRKWQKDHLVTNVVLAVLLLIMLVAGIVLSKPLVAGLAPVFAVVVYMIRRNDMMVYVENNLYGPIK